LGKVHDRIDDHLAAWIRQQTVFFVATSPLDRDGHVNCSPKGGDALRVLGPTTVAYQDLTGSGVETIAHLRENGRIVIMFCAFDGPPKIVRLHGRGEVIPAAHKEFASLRKHFPEHAGTRSLIRIQVTRVSDSCGFGVPLFEYRGDRDALAQWSESKGPTRLAEYRQEKNARSIDGLPGWGMDQET
jgi:predicted pyridoxine 5'-phosphate oxidase superfamily flavin-nucleotide-binding protein